MMQMQNLKGLKDYKLEREIGKGSFARVYLARTNETPLKKVAVKVLRNQSLSNKLLKNLELEIEIQRKLKHSNIVQLLDCIRSENYVYLIMEYCDLGDLATFMSTNYCNKGLSSQAGEYIKDLNLKWSSQTYDGLNPLIARHFIKQLSSAVLFLRRSKLVHRDIKPQNLLLKIPNRRLAQETAGHPQMPVLKLADFGFARYLKVASLANTLCGSPLYMAPEILKFEKYDARADLWSIGAVIYEMISGCPPYRARNHIQLLHKIEKSNSIIKFPSEHSGDKELRLLATNLLQISPSKRISFDQLFKDSVIQTSLDESDISKTIFKIENNQILNVADGPRENCIDSSSASESSSVDLDYIDNQYKSASSEIIDLQGGMAEVDLNASMVFRAKPRDEDMVEMTNSNKSHSFELISIHRQTETTTKESNQYANDTISRLQSNETKHAPPVKIEATEKNTRITPEDLVNDKNKSSEPEIMKKSNFTTRYIASSVDECSYISEKILNESNISKLFEMEVEPKTMPLNVYAPFLNKSNNSIDEQSTESYQDILIDVQRTCCVVNFLNIMKPIPDEDTSMEYSIIKAPATELLVLMLKALNKMDNLIKTLQSSASSNFLNLHLNVDKTIIWIQNSFDKMLDYCEKLYSERNQTKAFTNIDSEYSTIANSLIYERAVRFSRDAVINEAIGGDSMKSFQMYFVAFQFLEWIVNDTSPSDQHVSRSDDDEVRLQDHLKKLLTLLRSHISKIYCQFDPIS